MLLLFAHITTLFRRSTHHFFAERNSCDIWLGNEIRENIRATLSPWQVHLHLHTFEFCHESHTRCSVSNELFFGDAIVKCRPSHVNGIAKRIGQSHDGISPYYCWCTNGLVDGNLNFCQNEIHQYLARCGFLFTVEPILNDRKPALRFPKVLHLDYTRQHRFADIINEFFCSLVTRTNGEYKKKRHEWILENQYILQNEQHKGKKWLKNTEWSFED